VGGKRLTSFSPTGFLKRPQSHTTRRSGVTRGSRTRLVLSCSPLTSTVVGTPASSAFICSGTVVSTCRFPNPRVWLKAEVIQSKIKEMRIQGVGWVRKGGGVVEFNSAVQNFC